jgi:PAS domain S-box-containing protein
VPDFASYVARGQIEIVSPPEEQARADEALERRLDRAILAGFDGLRLVCQARTTVAETIRRLNVIAAVLYPRAELGAAGLMQVVQDHRFALVCNSGRWEVLEGSEARTSREALERSEEKLQSLFRNMSEGFAYHRIVLDTQGQPCDYLFLEVSPAFERLTGLVAQKILGRRVTQVLPGIETDPTDWIGRYGRVALTGEPAQFESHNAALDRWYAVSAFSPHKGYFAVTFADVTDRKRAESERRAAEERLLVTLRSIGDAVIATDMEGRVTLINRVAEGLTGWDEAEARGRPLSEVFRIVNADTGAAAEDPVRKVIEQGGVVGLAKDTVLIARDGRRIAIADSAAPVRGGELLGVVLVFRDVSAARLAEHERDLTIEFLRLVNENAQTGDLIRAVVTFFQDQSGCEAVGIRLKRGDDYPYYEARGFPREFLRLENQLCARDEAGLVGRDSTGNPVIECMCGHVIGGRTNPAQPFFSAGGSFWANDSMDACARGRCNREGYESVGLVPLRVGSERLGLLQFNDRRKGMFSPERIALWERLGNYLSVALARSLAEEALKESERRLRTLGDQIPAGAVYQHVLHPDGRVSYAYMSAGIESLLGTPVKDVLADAARFRELILEEDRPRVVAAEQRSARDLVVFDCEFRQRTITGEVKWVQCRSMPRRLGDGSVLWDGIVVDITERRRAEAVERELRQQAEHRAAELEAVLDSLAEPLLVSDAGGQILRANSAFRRVFGIPEDWRGVDVGERVRRVRLLSADGQPVDPARTPGERALAGETVTGVLQQLPRPDGSVLHLSTSSAPIRTTAGVLGAVVVFTDVTERVRAEQLLREEDQRKNEFMAVLSHELRNPLAPIKNSLYILDRAAPGGDQARRAEQVISRQVDQLSRLVNDLLDVTRISRNKVQLQCQRLELNELVRRTLEDYRTIFDENEVRLRLEPAPEPVFVNADWNRLAQVVGNLLTNAAKFTGRGGHVSIAIATDGAARSAVVRVADTGVGMAPEMLSRLFQPFAQAETTLDRSRGGLGLGLALVKGLVELHGGEVSASSTGLGQGTEIVVRLPLEVAEASLPAPSHPASAPRGRRVLVIEDNLDAADSLREVLEFGLHEVIVAYNGPEGLSKAREFRPEVVLCDIGLPGMDGFEVARAFRADEARRPDSRCTSRSRPAWSSSRSCSEVRAHSGREHRATGCPGFSSQGPSDDSAPLARRGRRIPLRGGARRRGRGYWAQRISSHANWSFRARSPSPAAPGGRRRAASRLRLSSEDENLANREQ